MLYFGTKRRVDWDNYHKISCDALSGVVYDDDSQIRVARDEKAYDAKNPRIEITVA
jgi:Holliday junction resolvase RusA-like endonuclease